MSYGTTLEKRQKWAQQRRAKRAADRAERAKLIGTKPEEHHEDCPRHPNNVADDFYPEGKGPGCDCLVAVYQAQRAQRKAANKRRHLRMTRG